MATEAAEEFLTLQVSFCVGVLNVPGFERDAKQCGRCMHSTAASVYQGGDWVPWCSLFKTRRPSARERCGACIEAEVQPRDGGGGGADLATPNLVVTTTVSEVMRDDTVGKLEAHEDGGGADGPDTRTMG